MPFRWTYFINLKSVSYQKTEHQIMFLPYEPLQTSTCTVVVKKYTLVLLISKRHLTPSGMKDSYTKLLHIDVGGCFYKLIQNLYSNTSCTLKIGISQTRSFHYLRGVRFSIYTLMIYHVHFKILYRIPSFFQMVPN